MVTILSDGLTYIIFKKFDLIKDTIRLAAAPCLSLFDSVA